MNFVATIASVSVIYVVVFVVERLPRLRFRPLSFRRAYLGTDLAWYVVAIAMTAVSVFLLRPLLDGFQIAPLAERVSTLPPVPRFALAVLVFDLISYAVHRGLHGSDVLWSIHKVHHSTLYLDGLATTRTHMFENLLRFVPGQLVMFLIGIPAAQIAPTVALAAAYGIVDHSNVGVNARSVERVLVTPRLHRRHHVPETSDKNFGAMFTIWDRLFGTFTAIDTLPDERFGCPGEVDTYPQRFTRSVLQPPRDIRAMLRRRRSAESLVERTPVP
jgi:sterol desaturase/sphingolipid hydroxylase (fatty acid hydroxylase superfamily)